MCRKARRMPGVSSASVVVVVDAVVILLSMLL